ncbi:MAG: YdbL family protein [Pseudomonadota bacterium]|jgi:hypothetical protein|nr:DUF1318 domain-containing protein [Pseudomonadota bacterium]QKK05369.1 MAG: YdbL family protein [Pseudomonadota bacterium]
MKQAFTVFFLCFAFLAVLPATAYAEMSVAAAKAQGYVGEQPDGLLGIVQAAPGVAAMVDSTNAGRLAKYRAVAQSNGLPLDQVQKLAGQKLMTETPAGQYIFLNSQWVKK